MTETIWIRNWLQPPNWQTSSIVVRGQLTGWYWQSNSEFPGWIGQMSSSSGTPSLSSSVSVIMQLGRIPAATDYFIWEGLKIEVVDMDGNRVDKVLVTPTRDTISEMAGDV